MLDVKSDSPEFLFLAGAKVGLHRNLRSLEWPKPSTLNPQP